MNLECQLHNHLIYTSMHCHSTPFLLIIQVYALQSPNGIFATDGSFDFFAVLRLFITLAIADCQDKSTDLLVNLRSRRLWRGHPTKSRGIWNQNLSTPLDWVLCESHWIQQMCTDQEQTHGTVRYSHGGEHLLHGHGAFHGGAFLPNKCCYVDVHFRDISLDVYNISPCALSSNCAEQQLLRLHHTSSSRCSFLLCTELGQPLQGPGQPAAVSRPPGTSLSPRLRHLLPFERPTSAGAVHVLMSGRLPDRIQHVNMIGAPPTPLLSFFAVSVLVCMRQN